jgi:dTDP-4-dehydrorhamnose 3,5-epimerase
MVNIYYAWLKVRMEIIRQKIPDVLLIKPKIHNDNRGYFMESFRQELLES